MEILSTGEKIKRARIYKGLTLKDICEDIISLSKMSCIENDKIKAEGWVLEHISKKLEIDLNFLKQDIREQIINNIEFLEKNKNLEDYEEIIEYNLQFAEKYSYSELCFKLIHILFNYYLDLDKCDKVECLTSKYYNLCQKKYSEENQLTYYMDMAKYLYVTREFVQAANYYNNVRKTSNEVKKLDILAKATYNEAACFIMIENYERAYEIAVRLQELVDYLEGDLRKAEVFHMLALLSLRMDKGRFEEYEKQSYKLYKHNIAHKAQAIFNYASVMFKVGIKDKAVEYINDALSLCPRENKEKYVSFMLLNVNELIENNILKEAQKICDEALDLSINLNNIKFIEKGYYYKALILQKEKNLASAEMYMNFSLDALIKFGTRQDIYKRYMEIGHMYFSLGQNRESIRYFNLAINLEKKI